MLDWIVIYLPNFLQMLTAIETWGPEAFLEMQKHLPIKMWGPQAFLILQTQMQKGRSQYV